MMINFKRNAYKKAAQPMVDLLTNLRNEINDIVEGKKDISVLKAHVDNLDKAINAIQKHS